MKFTALQVERFGVRSDLRLDHFSDQVNVVCGPEGVGKSTLIHVLEWMLFGGDASSDTSRALSGRGRFAGKLHVTDGHARRCVIERRDDLGVPSSVRVTSADGRSFQSVDPRRLTDVTRTEYRRFFSFSSSDELAVRDLLQLAAERGLSWDRQQADEHRLTQLTQRLAALRDADRGLRHAETTLDSLQQRRQQIELEIQAARARHAEAIRSLDAERAELGRDMADVRHRLSETELVLHRTEDRLEQRRRELDDAGRELARIRQQRHEQRNVELDEIDAQIAHWSELLESIRRRNESLRSRLAGIRPSTTSQIAEDEAELRVLLRTMGYQIDDIEQDLRDLHDSESIVGRTDHLDYLRSVMGTALYTMRNDVQRLYQEIDRQRNNARHHEFTAELRGVQRCESELTDLIDSLTNRRQLLLAETHDLPLADRHWLDHVDLDDRHRDGYWSDGRAWYLSDALADPILHARVTHLVQRRDALISAVNSLQYELAELQRRLDQREHSRQSLLEERQVESLMRELTDVNARIDALADHERRRAEMVALEDEIARLRSACVPSDLLREATSMLRRISAQGCRNLLLEPGGDVVVEDERGQRVRYLELGRGARHQVYLSLALAVVAELRRRQIELPLVLHEIFEHLDSERQRCTAGLLSELAASGQQMVIVTRHEHVARLFPAERTRVLRLAGMERAPEPRPISTPLPAPMPVEPSWVYLDRIDQANSIVPPPTVTPVREEPARPAWRRETSYNWVAQWDPPPSQSSTWPLSETTAPPTDVYVLREESLLSHVLWLDRNTVRQLAVHGVHTVRQFLDIEPEDAERMVGPGGETARQLYRAQSKVSLQCYVGLGELDADLLMSCGVDDPEELSCLEASELHRRIDLFLSRGTARETYGSISRYERQRLSRWIEAARRSGFRRSRTRWARFRQPVQVAEPETNETSDQIESLIRPAAAEVMPRPKPVAPPPAKDEAESQPLRFFLQVTDPVVDAPSIGPKTAERLEAVGVHTVEDLLTADADIVATRINYPRINADLIRDWQTQTRLVCQIPNLRGHDAQLLVAMSIRSVGQLLGEDPEQLLQQLKRLTRSAEGKRILRNGKHPDLAEVQSWIAWARQARKLQLT